MEALENEAAISGNRFTLLACVTVETLVLKEEGMVSAGNSTAIGVLVPPVGAADPPQWTASPITANRAPTLQTHRITVPIISGEGKCKGRAHPAAASCGALFATYAMEHGTSWVKTHPARGYFSRGCSHCARDQVDLHPRVWPIRS